MEKKMLKPPDSLNSTVFFPPEILYFVIKVRFLKSEKALSNSGAIRLSLMNEYVKENTTCTNYYYRVLREWIFIIIRVLVGSYLL